MDIERIKKISEAKIKAGYVVDKVRKTLKEFEHGRQDIQEELSEVYKPIVKAQEDVKQTIDEKQDKMLEQLQKNQKAITSGLEDILMIQQLPDVQPQETAPRPIDYEPAMLKPQFKSDIDTGFDVASHADVLWGSSRVSFPKTGDEPQRTSAWEASFDGDEIKKLTNYGLYIHRVMY